MEVVGGVLVRNNKILLPKRSYMLSKYPGFYEFPGGKVEKGETLKFALKRELFEELSIDVPRLDLPVLSMSGGQRQCVAISRLLLDQVNLILMDEPMAALGVAEGKKVLDMIERLKEKGVSVLIISHNLEHVFSIADRISVLKNGRMIGTVSPKKVNRSDVVRMITTGENIDSEGAMP